MEAAALDLECGLLMGRGCEDLLDVLSAMEKNSKPLHQDYLEELQLIVKCVAQGDYVKVLRQPTAQLVLRGVALSEDFATSLRENVRQFVSVQDMTTRIIRQLLVLCIGVSCLKLFLQENWLGPNLSQEQKEQLPALLQQDRADAILHACLRCESEEIYNQTSLPAVFAVARFILSSDHLDVCKTEAVWSLRCLYCHQCLLDEHSISLKEEIMSAIQRMTTLTNMDIPRCLAQELDLEVSYICLFYYEHNQAKERLRKVKSEAGLEVKLTGALGKRTYFQENALPQLLLDVQVPERTESDIKEKEPDLEELPKDVSLGDDTIMPQIKFSEEHKIPILTTLEQAIVFAICYHHMKTHAHFSLLVEELIAYLTCLLNQPRDWCIQTAALVLRSKLEENKRRMVERSMMQCQSVFDQVGRQSPNVTSRMRHFHCSVVPPKWIVEKELAFLLIKLGSMNSALEVFTRLEMWEEAIECYMVQGRYEKAENLVKEQLAIKETPKLFCLLGDLTKDMTYYEKAWEVSSHRSARAQRSLGYHYLRQGKFEECIPHFEKSLVINCMQVPVWFSFGCAAMKINNFPLACKALYRCVGLQPEHAEAWSNLSAALIGSGKISKAFYTLQEALKADYRNWRIWENYLVVCMDLREYNKAIEAYHHLLDLKDKFKDIQALAILVGEVISIKEDDAEKGTKLRAELQKLMGRITSCISGDEKIWLLYHDLCKSGQTDEDKDKALQFLIKGHRIKSQSQECEKDADKCKNLINLTLDLTQEYVEASSRRKAEAVQLLSSAKLNMKSLQARIKKHHTGVDGTLNAVLVEPSAELDSKLEEILAQIETARSNAQ